MGKSARGDNFYIRRHRSGNWTLCRRDFLSLADRIKFCGRGGNGSTCSSSETLSPIPHRAVLVLCSGAARDSKRERGGGGGCVDESAFCGASFMNSFYSGYLTADLQQSTGSLNKSSIVLYFEQVIQVAHVNCNIFMKFTPGWVGCNSM